MTGIRILADDLTGALDTAAAFSGQVPVFIDSPPGAGQPFFDSPVSVVSTPTRDVPPESLSVFLQPVLAWLKSGTLAFKKVDSLLRGNTFAELAWLTHQGDFDLAVFAPAFPAQGRITVNDRQWVVKADCPRLAVATPLQETFARCGLRACKTRVPCDESFDVWMPEVVTDGDLDQVVDEAERMEERNCLWCGSAGLAHALARRRGLAPVAGGASPLPKGNGPTVLVSASFQPVLREQWALLQSDWNNLAVARRACEEEVIAAINQAHKNAENVWFDLSPEGWISPEQALEQLNRQTARLIAELPKPGQLVVVGGDTLLGLCRASGASAMLAHPAVRQGWGCARLIGGLWDGVPCYSRSGAFGGSDDLLTMMRLLNCSPITEKEI